MTITSYNPRTGQANGTVREMFPDEVRVVVERASDASSAVAAASPRQRRGWLHAVAAALVANTAELVELAEVETALGYARLTSEVSRAAGQLRFYGDVAAEGSYLAATIDRPTGTTPGLARVNQPLGPVAVFGASNFPFAFGVLGNDFASALAAGCPVVAKGHPAHPLLSDRLARLARTALVDAGPRWQSRNGGRLRRRRHPHPRRRRRRPGFHRLTGSRPRAVAHSERAANGHSDIRRNVDSESRRGHQGGGGHPDGGDRRGVCGLLHAWLWTVLHQARSGVRSSGSSGSRGHRQGSTAGPAEPVMLTEAIARSAAEGLEELRFAGAHVLELVEASVAGWCAPAAVLEAPIDALQNGSRLLEECFGAVAVIVEYADVAELAAAVDRLQGSLAASVFTADGDDTDAAACLALLSPKVGRLCANDWPTGVAYSWAQQHGGPWPSTSAPSATSVGAAALDRFVRPVTYQSLRDEWLPPALQAANPWGLPRRVNGMLQPLGATP